MQPLQKRCGGFLWNVRGVFHVTNMAVDEAASRLMMKRSYKRPATPKHCSRCTRHWKNCVFMIKA